MIMSCMHFELFIISMHVLPFFAQNDVLFCIHFGLGLHAPLVVVFFKGKEFSVHAHLSGFACFSGGYFFEGKGRPFFYPVESTRPCSSPPLSFVFNRQRKA